MMVVETKCRRPWGSGACSSEAARWQDVRKVQGAGQRHQERAGQTSESPTFFPVGKPHLGPVMPWEAQKSQAQMSVSRHSTKHTFLGTQVWKVRAGKVPEAPAGMQVPAG